ncbi:ATP-binding protein [Streptomyces sp. B3I8]|uniref:ATP-binding protein n=1 Tax=Streptomyces sp. B3I8 TaxID=3042303 RepID=UPI002786AF2E|nr:ATP-binding protein [Streptomyces sp. B3I8]MDQ0788680.1 anti-sigma regulatory factor (Ser/Thr protein kinase) [Streptomyces sp. B3I8]
MVTVAPPRSEVSPSWAYALHLPRDARAVRIARVTLRAVLAGHGMGQLIDNAELLTSELVTNAYRHSDGPAFLRLRGPENGRRVRVSVWDSNPYIPPPFDRRPGLPRHVPPEAHGGRGLLLVRHYAEAWGGYPLGDGLFRVWWEAAVVRDRAARHRDGSGHLVRGRSAGDAAGAALSWRKRHAA